MIDNLFDYGQEKIDRNDTVATEPSKEQLLNTYNKYKGLNQDELMQELKRVTKEKKQSGTLNNSMINDMAKKIKSVLTPEQQKKLDEVLKNIDD